MLTYRKGTTHRLTITATDIDNEAVTSLDTIEATVKDQAGNEIADQTWPVSLSAQGDGTFTASIDSDLDVTVGQVVDIEVTAVNGSHDAFARLRTKVREDND